MVEKLKSILRQTHWSLLLKAASFVVIWTIAPVWVSILSAIGFYLIPSFRFRSLLVPFLLTLFYIFHFPHNVFAALSLGVLLVLILGTKDLLFVDRSQSYEILVLILIFISFLYSFLRFGEWNEGLPFLWFLLPALTSFLLIRGMASYVAIQNTSKKQMSSRVAALISLFLWELSIVLLFSPINFIYATSIVFLAALFFIELYIDNLSGNLNKNKLLFYLSTFFIVFVIILASIEWRL